ncbi:hypothetical protein HHI36_009198 [Cryptolaemus montrouzieri]|uniref:Uncharacterized protein n=1 Tax=Cryptolaemus montrouzieri TaxID=559131 RepID=A0ABD2MVE9_9CUCU
MTSQRHYHALPSGHSGGQNVASVLDNGRLESGDAWGLMMMLGTTALSIHELIKCIASNDEEILHNSDSLSENEENHDLENITRKMIVPKENKSDNISLGDLPSCSYSTQREMRRNGTHTKNVIIHEDKSSSSDEEQPDQDFNGS